MDWFWGFIKTWLEVIASFFKDYPLAAALLSIAGVFAFIYLKQKLRYNKYVTLVIVIAVWSILVPIVGFLMEVLSDVISVASGFARFLVGLIGFFYAIFDRHPYMILSLFVVGAIGCYLWMRLRPCNKKVRIFRIVVVSTIWFLLTALLAPFADRLLSSPSDGSSPTREPREERALEQVEEEPSPKDSRPETDQEREDSSISVWPAVPFDSIADLNDSAETRHESSFHPQQE